MVRLIVTCLVTIATCVAFQPVPLMVRRTSLVPQVALVAPTRRTTEKTSLTSLSALTVDAAGSMISTFYESQPYLSAFLTCSVKASAADFVAQKNAVDDNDETADPEDVNLSRNFAFILYGGIYQGLAQQFMYSVLFPAWFGNGHTLSSIALPVVVDSVIIAPLLCLPIAYCFKSVVASGWNPSLDTFKEAISKYVEDVTERGLLVKYSSLWIPVQCLTFGVIPQHFRVAFVAAVSFFWIFILSSVSAEETTSPPDEISSSSSAQEDLVTCTTTVVGGGGDT